MRLISLVLALFLFWLALSGHYTPTLIAVGAASAIACALVAARMGIADREGHPIHLAGRFVTFFPWLLCEIAKSAWAVTKIIVNPALPISPTMTRVQASQRSSLGVVTYANSITLRATSPRRMASKPSLIWSSPMRADTSSSSFKRPLR